MSVFIREISAYNSRKKDRERNKELEQFLRLPGELYAPDEYMQNDREVEQVLKGTHPLSHYFIVYPLLALDEKGQAVGRAVLTVYPEDTTGYLGFFESVQDSGVSGALIAYAEGLARQQGCDRLLGPVDASFWIRYRFKTNRFGSPYTGEPYNKPYYTQLWRAAGFETAETYYSNHYRVIHREDDREKYTRRLAGMKEQGYVIKSPCAEEFDKVLREVYELLIVLYRQFPAYKYITEDEFCSLFSYLKKLLVFDMVKLCYLQGKPVGFCVSIPDYGNLVYGKMTLSRLWRFLRIHKKPESYVILYMGAGREHRGLGSALAEAVKEELIVKQTPSVGALIRKGNFTRGYFKHLIDYDYEYVLMEKVL